MRATPAVRRDAPSSAPMRRRRILFLIANLEIGGTERQLVELASQLDRSRFEPVVCCLGTGGPLEPVLTARGVPVEILGLRRPLRAARLLAPVRLWRLVRRLRPDVVHGLLFWGCVAGALGGRLAGVPAVVASRRNLGQSRGQPMRATLRRLATRFTDLVIANSEAVRRAACRQERLREDRVIVIPNGVDGERLRAAADSALRGSLGLEDTEPVVVVVANLLPYKGHRVFLEAWSVVAGRCPRARALLVGDGPLRAEMQDWLEATGLRCSVRILGAREDVPSLLALADVVAHPSLEEGLPNAVLEALAIGKPVVATAVGGTAEAVSHGRTGLLVPPGDAPALADAILRLLGDPRGAQALGRAGQRDVTERFPMATMVRAYEAAYDRVLASARRPAGPSAAAP